MTITIELPEELSEQVRAAADAQGEDVTRWAVAALAAAVKQAAPTGVPLGPYSEYPSREAYVAEAVRRAPDFGIEPDLAAALAEGIADMEEGRTLSLEEARAELEAHKAAWRQRRRASLPQGSVKD